jgi:hypothetical protein
MNQAMKHAIGQTLTPISTFHAIKVIESISLYQRDFVKKTEIEIT